MGGDSNATVRGACSHAAARNLSRIPAICTEKASRHCENANVLKYPNEMNARKP